jgi:hypothetical protein
MKYIISFIFFLVLNITFGQDVFSSIKTENHEELTSLLKNGGRIDKYNENGLTPLWMAAFKNDSASVKTLIYYGADVNGLTKNGMPPIVVGSIVSGFESVRILLTNGADVNWKSSASKNQQPIRFASNKGTVEFVQMLLAAGADLESKADDGGTPLLAAVYSNNYNLAKFYFEQGANVNLLARDGECIIHEAIKTKNPEMVELALKHKSPLNYKDAEGRSTMEIANAIGNRKIKRMIENAVKDRI